MAASKIDAKLLIDTLREIEFLNRSILELTGEELKRPTARYHYYYETTLDLVDRINRRLKYFRKKEMI